jgi:23S rRNA (guanosine2251-2'-O)-methyltransferase
MIQVEGRNPVQETLKTIKPVKILVAIGVKEDPRIQKILKLARTKKVAIEFVEKKEINKLSQTRRHQGVIAVIDRPGYTSLREVVEDDRDNSILILDDIQDPMNLGSILRTAEGTGARGVIIPKKGGVGLTETVVRASMGGALNIPIVRHSLYQAVKLLRDNDFRIIGVDPSGSTNYFNEDLTGSIAFVFGGEGKGISPTLLSKCDLIVKIPMVGQVKSLNVGVSAAVILYDRHRQMQSCKSARSP